MSDAVAIHMDQSLWGDVSFPDSPFSQREAFLWVGCFGPVSYSERRLAAQWQWTKGKVREFVRAMRLRGRLILAGGILSAAPCGEQKPDAGFVEGDSWRSMRLRVFARDGFACTYCGDSNDLHCDHILARANGGLDVESNLTTSCRACNLSKGKKLLNEWVRP